jgi:cellulose synthase/poly-beta-1,6-N-acetylglucosamine synthase-like glycosyltransferase
MTITDAPVCHGLSLGKLLFKKSIAVLILARDEANVISTTVQSARQALEPRDAIFVIADHCQDNTADRAAVAGAFVLERSCGKADGKGAALKWLIEQEGDCLDSFDLVVILDADTMVPPDFLRKIKADYQEGTVMQCLVQPSGYHGSALATLIALSEIHEQQTIDQIRAWFGWPVRLRGTGMVLSTSQLSIVAGLAATEVEDIALSLLFTSRGIAIRRNDQIRVYDPKPHETLLASRQRARWFRGQWGTLLSYHREAWCLVRRGPAGWSMLSSLFLKPRWLADALWLFFAALTAPFFWPLAGLLLARVLLDFVSLMYTILTSQDRMIFLKAILYAPSFIVMWLRSFFLASQKSSWLRARP